MEKEKTYKKKNRLSWMYSIFPKLLLTFAVITVPILLASFWLNRRAEQITRDQILTITWEQMQGNIGRFDEQVLMLNNLMQYICSNSDEVKMLANLPEALTVYERGQAMKTINQQFIQIKLVTAVVQDVRIHLKKTEKTVSAASLSSSLDRNEYDFIMETPLSASKVVNYNGKLLMFATSAENMNYAPEVKESTFFMVVELSVLETMNYMTQGSGAGGVSVFLSDDGSFRSVSGEGTDGVTDQIVNTVLEQPDFIQDILTIGGTDYIVLRQKSAQTGLNLIQYINFDENFSIFKVYSHWLIIFVLIVLSAVAVFVLIVYRTVQKPMNELIAAFRKVEKGDFNVSIQYEKNDEFRYLYHRFDRMVENTRNLIEQVYEQQILSQRAELRALQSQINPHFLYNSFFIISVMARRGDMEFVESFTGQLGKYFQFIVKNDKEMIPLSEEVEYAKLYADIQMTRFSSRITITIEEAPEKYKDRPVPRLIIQPLIENALAYGLEKKKADGRLRIYFQEEDGWLVIYVEDNGDFMTREVLESLREKMKQSTAEAKMSGLFNIHRRLAIQYGDRSGLEFAMLPEGGLQVKLKIEFGGTGHV